MQHSVNHSFILPKFTDVSNLSNVSDPDDFFDLLWDDEVTNFIQSSTSDYSGEMVSKAEVFAILAVLTASPVDTIIGVLTN